MSRVRAPSLAPNIIMKIYLAHSSKLNYKDDLYDPIRRSTLNKEHEIIYFCDDPAYTNKSSKEIILQSDVVIAEISEESTGLGIEIGWANANGIRIIFIHKTGKAIKEYMKSISAEIVEYDSTETLIDSLKKLL